MPTRREQPPSQATNGMAQIDVWAQTKNTSVVCSHAEPESRQLGTDTDWSQWCLQECGVWRGKREREVIQRERAWRAVCVLSRVVLKDGHEPWRTQETLKSFRLPLECPATSTWERENTSSIYTTIGVYQHQHSCIIHAFYRKHLWRMLADTNPHGKHNCSNK